MKPKPKSVVLDVLSTLRGRSAPVRFLVATAEIFGIDSNATRVAITRLLATGLVERDERGAYRSGPAAAPIVRRLSSWRRIDKRTCDWDGSWAGATPDAGGFPKEDRALAVRALEFCGMREFSPGLWVRPNNLDGGLPATRESLMALRLPAGCPLFTIRDFDAAGEARARSLWDADEIRSLYRRLAADLEASAARLEGMDEARAMAESFVLGGEAIRCIVLDPLLPDEIVSTDERTNLVHAMTAYDEIGRRCWAPFLNRYGVLVSDSPMDLQIWRETAPGGLAAAPLDGETA
ncbi:MAG: PaaX family transcriptional regulator [Candidatus Binatia bacterium]